MVSDGFRANLIARGVPAAKVHTIRNGVNVARVHPGRPAPAQSSGPGSAQPPGDCLVLYAGTHGISQGLPGLAGAAAALTG